MSGPPRVRFEELIGLWEEGTRRLAGVDAADRGAVDRVVAELVLELRRHLGESFMVDELASYYLEAGTDWCLAVAARLAPSTPAAWDMTTVAGAAFARFARKASDYGGGRVQQDDDQR